MAKELTSNQFRENIKKNLQNENIIMHSERKQPNTSPPTDNELFISSANGKVDEYASIITDMLKS